MSHSLERTSPKGGPFIGRCTKCGTEDKEARALADELGTITEERHSIVLAALARFEAQARLAGERAGMERAAAIASNSARHWRNFTKMNLPIAPSPIINEDRAKTAEGIAAVILKEAATPGGSNG